jgi:prevent-host-death family protein
MSTVEFVDSAASLGDLLNRAHQGQTITLVRDGEPQAVLRPADPADAADRSAAIEELLAFRNSRTLGGATVRELIEEGRRF